MKAAVRISLALAAIPLGIVAYRVQVHDLGSSGYHAAGIVAVAWTFLAAGLVLWWRRPQNRVGLLITASGLALLLRQLRYSHDAALFTTFFAVGELGYVLVGHSVLVLPSGSLTGRAERWVVKLAYVAALALPLATLLVYDSTRPISPIFFGEARPESLLLVAGDAELADVLQKVLVVALYGVLVTLLVILIGRRLVRAGHRGRRVLAPLLIAAIALAVRSVFQCVFTFVDRPFADDYLYWWQIGAFIAVPLALLGALVRARLARVAVGDLVVELEHTPPKGLRDALARALEDPTLEVAFWLPERQGFVDGAGRPVELPPNGATRAVTRLEHDGEPVAALIHDPSLLEEPRLVEAAGAAARLALDNARLHAETRAQLEEVQASRARIVEAADAERRRIERDLHDGAQQRLVALALQVRGAQSSVTGDVEVERLLAETVGELQEAVRELRELARGVHPAVLTEDGLAAALESLASRSPFPVSLDVCEERLPMQAEATAYFVACEGLANIGKHAQAANARICTRRRDGALVIEVEDDGIGGARVDEGSGLRGLADRVEAVGGTLTVTSPPGGTRIVAEIPCAQ